MAEESTFTIDGKKLSITTEIGYRKLSTDRRFHACRYCHQLPPDRKEWFVNVVYVCYFRGKEIRAGERLHTRAVNEVQRKLRSGWGVCPACVPAHADARDY